MLKYVFCHHKYENVKICYNKIFILFLVFQNLNPILFGLDVHQSLLFGLDVENVILLILM